MVTRSSTFLHLLLVIAAALVVAVFVAKSAVFAQAPIKVLLVTGQSNRFHNWVISSRIVKRELEASSRFVVTLMTTPPNGSPPNQDMSSFTPTFANYQVVVLDYEGLEFAPPVKDAFAAYVRNGGGLVTLHAADNAFPAWPEFNEMIGVGGWGGLTPGYSNGRRKRVLRSAGATTAWCSTTTRRASRSIRSRTTSS